MKKKIWPVIGIAGLISLALTACGEGNGFDNYFQIDQSQYKVTFNELRTANMYDTEANQKGDVRALVIPVEFKGYSADDLPAGREGTIEDIEKALFGGDSSQDEEIAWESLSSFYKKSSYNQCNITGDVLDTWYYVDMTPVDFAKKTTVDTLLSEIYTYYTMGAGKGTIDIDSYDANDDGYIDLTLFVYSCPTGADKADDSIFWAYTTQHFNATKPIEGQPALISRYWWASYTFMYEDGYYDDKGGYHDWTTEQIKNNEAKIDAHTFIHESGHGLGLADYYSYDYNGDAPMGGVDMMDNNVGDHNAYSKALMGWISPYVVEGNARITLRPFNEYGDAIIVPIREKNWKENSYTLLDEYLIIEYDTPTGLAVSDGLDKYAGNYPLYYNQAGVRIMHTDSRMGAFYNDNGKAAFAQYISRPKLTSSQYWADFAHDNTASRSVNGNRLLELVKPDGSRHLKGVVHNEVLWQEGGVLKNFEMNTKDSLTNENYNLGFDIKIVSITELGATIEITVAK